MAIEKLNKTADNYSNAQLRKEYHLFEKLVAALDKKELPDSMTASINADITVVNTFAGTEKEQLNNIRIKKRNMLQRLEKELKIVPRNHYRTLWMVLGMTAFGLPMGVAFGLAVNNIALMGLGLPIGMPIGIAIGSSMDKKAAAEGRQLDFEN